MDVNCNVGREQATDSTGALRFRIKVDRMGKQFTAQPVKQEKCDQWKRDIVDLVIILLRGLFSYPLSSHCLIRYLGQDFKIQYVTTLNTISRTFVISFSMVFEELIQGKQLNIHMRTEKCCVLFSLKINNYEKAELKVRVKQLDQNKLLLLNPY